MQVPPPVVSRSPFAEWLFARGIRPSAAAAALDCSKQTILNICKPFSDAGRTVPHEALMERIVIYTGRAITASDFYPEHLRRADELSGAPLPASIGDLNGQPVAVGAEASR